jgi:tetratricopeptide (TPR) repeat protein
MKSPFVIIFLLVSIFTYAQDTEDFDFYYNEGVKNYDIDNYETALEFFVKALEIEPNHVDTNYKIGNTFSFLGNPYYAIQFLLRTTELDSSHFKAHFNTAAVAYEILEFELSIEYYIKCLPMNESLDLVNYGLAASYFAIGDYNTSKKFNDLALEINSNLSDAKTLKTMLARNSR